ncbi:MAG TPA: hypothetical protein VK860_00390, partial [Ilumatobacteraceae bacterium]|nr:hypothetical protein [Ilumatobacteraceae bacterium]
MRDKTMRRLLLAVLAAVALVAAACGDDDTTDAGGDEPSATTAAADESDATEDEDAGDEDASADDGAVAAGQPDTNGDGKVVIGILSAGDTNDGGYFQGLVDESRAFAEAQSPAWEVIVVDQVGAADARQQMENLLSQGVDIFGLGGGDLLYPQLREVAADPQWENVAFTVMGAQDRTPDPVVTSLTDNNDVISFSAGVAAGLALQ